MDFLGVVAVQGEIMPVQGAYGLTQIHKNRENPRNLSQK
jgi:hypothetical protein